MRKFYILLALCALLLAPVPRSGAQASERFKVRLTTVPMDGGMRNTVAGFGSGTATLAGSTLSITGSFDGLKSPATAAALKSGVARGVRGNPVADLTVSKATKGTLSGSVDLTPEQVKGLRDGKFYIEISSEKAPDGNLWGWILK
ncbi:MAG TPA: CHRD domain-containing protein [Vicinamibacterales bacterium]|nr:CHRD domain-containing protein [Vicinamibacterales bacterium]